MANTETPFTWTKNKDFPFFVGEYPVKFCHLHEADTGPRGDWTPKATLSLVISEEEAEAYREALQGEEAEAIRQRVVELEKSKGTKAKMKKAPLPSPKIDDDMEYVGETEDDQELVPNGQKSIKLSVRWDPVDTKHGPKSLRPTIFDERNRMVSDKKTKDIPEDLPLGMGAILRVYARPRLTWNAKESRFGWEVQPTHVKIVQGADAGGSDDNPFGEPEEDAYEENTEGDDPEEDPQDTPDF
jgi:hypothetical protein